MSDLPQYKKLDRIAGELIDAGSPRVIHLWGKYSMRKLTAFPPRSDARLLIIELPTVQVRDIDINGLSIQFTLSRATISRMVEIAVSPLADHDWLAPTAWFHPHINGGGRMCGWGAFDDVRRALEHDEVSAMMAAYANMHMIKQSYLGREDWHWLYFEQAVKASQGSEARDSALMWLAGRGYSYQRDGSLAFSEAGLEEMAQAVERYKERGIRPNLGGHNVYATYNDTTRYIRESLAEVGTAEERRASLLERSQVWTR